MLHLFVRHVFKFALSIVILKYLDILNSEKKCELIFLISPKYIYIYIYLLEVLKKIRGLSDLGLGQTLHNREWS